MKRDIVVIGGSAGSIKVLEVLLPSFSKKVPVSVFVTVHRAASEQDYLPEIFSRFTELKVLSADHNSVEHNMIYVAPPNRHLSIKRGHMMTTLGPLENRSRPAIDVTFRTAARAYGRRVVGVLLTGYLDDGTAGLGAIKDEGGVVIVQDPRDAYAPDMPTSAIRYVPVDYIVPVIEMKNTLDRLLRETLPTTSVVRQAENVIEELPTTFTCPDCGGSIYRVEKGDFHQYRCQIGHVYSPKSMHAAQADQVEWALWSTMRLLKERQNLLSSELSASSKRSDSEKAALRAELRIVEKRILTMSEIMGSENL